MNFLRVVNRPGMGPVGGESDPTSFGKWLVDPTLR